LIRQYVLAERKEGTIPLPTPYSLLNGEDK